MSINKDSIESFIGEFDGEWHEGWRAMSQDLVNALVEKFGGIEKFLTIHAEVENGKTVDEVVGFNKEAELLAFYDENVDDIMQHADNCACRTGDESITDMLRIQFSETDIDEDGIEAALDEDACDFSDASAERIEVCGWLVLCAAADLLANYTHFLEDEAEKNLIE